MNEGEPAAEYTFSLAQNQFNQQFGKQSNQSDLISTIESIADMHLTIHTFGIARDICGGPTLRLELPDPATAGHLKQLLVEQYPRLGQLASFLLAVNEEYAEPDLRLSPEDEIAVIPPVSGG